MFFVQIDFGIGDQDNNLFSDAGDECSPKAVTSVSGKANHICLKLSVITEFESRPKNESPRFLSIAISVARVKLIGSAFARSAITVINEMTAAMRILIKINCFVCRGTRISLYLLICIASFRELYKGFGPLSFYIPL